MNGVALPNFSDAVGNIPTLPLNSPGSNYGQQFLFALTHAMAVADFFGCRVVMSRSLVPLFSGDYLDEHQLSFVVDGVPRNMRWLLPADEYCFKNSLQPDQEEQAKNLYAAVCQVYEAAKGLTYKRLAWNIRCYLKLIPQIKDLAKEERAHSFEFGVASLSAVELLNIADYDLNSLDQLDQSVADDTYRQILNLGITAKVQKMRRTTLEKYFTTKARFNFRDSFQPPKVLIHDPDSLLTGDEYITYSALHLIKTMKVIGRTNRSDWRNGQNAAWPNRTTNLN